MQGGEAQTLLLHINTNLPLIRGPQIFSHRSPSLLLVALCTQDFCLSKFLPIWPSQGPVIQQDSDCLCPFDRWENRGSERLSNLLSFYSLSLAWANKRKCHGSHEEAKPTSCDMGERKLSLTVRDKLSSKQTLLHNLSGLKAFPLLILNPQADRSVCGYWV